MKTAKIIKQDDDGFILQLVKTKRTIEDAIDQPDCKN